MQHLCFQLHPESLSTHNGLLSRNLAAWHHHVCWQHSDRQRIRRPFDLLKIGDVPCFPGYVVNPPQDFLLVLFCFPSPSLHTWAARRSSQLLSCSVPCSDTNGCVNLCRPDDHLSLFSSPQRPGGPSCCSFPVPSEGCAHCLLASRFRNTSNDTEESSDLPVTWQSNPELGLWVVKCADVAGHCSLMTPDSSFSFNFISQHRTYLRAWPRACCCRT